MRAHRFLSIIALIAIAASLRVLPHPANVTPTGAIALFAGAYISDRRWAFAVPVIALLLGDLILGGYSMPVMTAVYASFLAAVAIGMLLRRRRTPGPIAAATLAGSTLFFLVTNFAVWMFGTTLRPQCGWLAGVLHRRAPVLRAHTGRRLLLCRRDLRNDGAGRTDDPGRAGTARVRIVSFLPSATEMVYALGLGDHLLGRSHECSYPPEALRKPVVSRPALPVESMTPGEIDRAVSARLHAGESLYRMDVRQLEALAPDLILTAESMRCLRAVRQ